MNAEKTAGKLPFFSFDALQTRVNSIEYVVAGFITVVWLSALLTYGAGYFGIFGAVEGQKNPSFLDVILYFSALVMPIMFLWLGAYMIRQTRQMNEDAQRLKDSVETLRSAVALNSPATSEDVVKAISDATAAAMRAEQSRITTQFRNLNDQQTKIEKAVLTLLKSRGQEHEAITQLVETAQDVAEKAVRKASSAEARESKLSKMTFDAIHNTEGQDALPFEAPESPVATDLDWAELVRALNFPEDENDTAGFAAIKRVLPNRLIAQLLQASEDVLSMLAQEGIYMDDLNTDKANPDVWRLFAKGTRGAAASEMGTIHDQAAVALTRGRMRADHIFKDSSLHFLRLFDRFLQEHLADATDLEIQGLAETRTGRAFQLMARVSGSFD